MSTSRVTGSWMPGMPAATGLYDPDAERDSCGFAFVATLRGTPGRDIVDAGLTALLNLDHRGAVGAEVDSGDGAGILTQIPDAFLRDVVDADLPAAGYYAIGLAFLPTDDEEQRRAVRAVEAIAGVPLHKQNFRRALERADLVEGLGRMDAETGGRPAELFRFRKELLSARPVSGLSLPLLRE